MGKTKRVAGTDQPIVGVEIVVEPVVVQVPATIVEVEVPHVAIAVRVLPEMRKMLSMPLPFEYSWGCTNNLTFYTKYLYFLKIRCDSHKSPVCRQAGLAKWENARE